MARTTIRTEDITASEVTTAKMAVDPTNASNLSSGSVPLAQLGNVDTTGLEDDIALLGFKVASNGSLAKYNLVDQIVDDFQDTSGVDASASTDENRSASNYYYGATISQGNCTGGTITDYTVDGNDYKVNTFTADGTFGIPASGTVDIFILAGGGNGMQNHGGGGGAGGAKYYPAYSVTEDDITIDVGAANASSSYASLTATRGGNGSNRGATAQTGGSGGGGGVDGGSGNSGTTYEGNAGGDAPYGQAPAAGGGGFSGVGQGGGTGSGGGRASGLTEGSTSMHNWTTGSGTSTAKFNGTGNTYATGGAGSGGGSNESANTGNGGNGGTGGNSGKAGGSGLVVVRYIEDSFSIETEGDMTLVSTTTAAQAAPTKGDIVFTYTNGAGTTTLGTDVTAEISADGGSTWTAMTLGAEGSTGSHNIATAHDVTISSTITSPYNMAYRIKTLNQSASKTTRIQAVSLGWS